MKKAKYEERQMKRKNRRRKDEKMKTKEMKRIGKDVQINEE